MSTPTGTGPHSRTPPGWPGDDPTEPDELGDLGRRPRRSRPAGRHPRVREERPPPKPSGPAAKQGPSPRPAPAREPDTAEGTAPAGRVLVVMVAALVLAMLVNADALVARTERRDPGPARDRALAVWHPIQDVSHALQLHRVRQFADWVAGNDDDRSPVPEPAPETASLPGRRELPRPGGDLPDTPPTTEGPAALRTPTTGRPLRLWVGGDSMSEAFGRELATQAQATGVIDPTVHTEMASGLTRPDYFDWPAALAADLEAADPEVVVAVFGVNDAQGIVLPDGTPVPEVTDPRWTGEYRRRVGAVMDQLRADDRLVLWVTQPPMRDPEFNARIAVVNQAIAAEAATRPWIVLVDSAPVVGATTPDVRRSDGIHLTEDGGARLATDVLGLLGERVDLTAGAVN